MNRGLMMSDVIKLYPKDAAMNPDNVLEQAIGKYEKVFILGWNKDGLMDARVTLNLAQMELNWLLDQFKMRLVGGDYADTHLEDDE